MRPAWDVCLAADVGRAPERPDDILLALACIVAVLAMLVLRPARSRPVPARVITGDAVVTDEGVAGRVDQLDGAFALVRVPEGRGVWVETGKLMRGDPGTPPLSEGSPGHHYPSPASLPVARDLLERLGEGVFAARRTIAVGWLAIVVTCLPLSATAEKSFSAGGFLPPGEALKVQAEVQEDFGMPLTRETVIVPGTTRQVTAKLMKAGPDLLQVDHVLAITTPRGSKDGKLVAFDVAFDATDDIAQNSYEPVNEVLARHGFDSKTMQVAGTPAFWADTSTQTKEDLAKAEAIGFPAAMLVLVLVFGTVVAAVLPLLVGATAVIVTLALLHLLSLPLDLSIFVMNIASMLGFGLGIDYSLLGVTRFREELDRGRSVHEATVVTIASAGRAAVISGVAVLVGLSALAVIELSILQSIAIAGVVVVAVTVLASITLLPALLAMLGRRVERLPVRRRRSHGEGASAGRWHALAHAVMRHPGLAIAVAAVVLLALAAPVRNVHLDVPHTEVLPADSPSNVAQKALEQRFGEQVTAPAMLVLETVDKAKVDGFLQHIRALDGVAKASRLATSQDGKKSLLLVTSKTDPQGGAGSRQLARDLHRLDPPAKLRIGGQGQGEIEFLNTVKRGIPRTVGLVFLSTFVILAVAFRSLTLPLKAIVLDTMSILAAMGAVIAVFQLGHGASLLNATPLGYTEATIPIILFCVLFGLSMDYEVFMLAKVSERYQQGDDNREATAQGVATTAPLVTGAALILIVIGLSFALTRLVLVKQIGFGMAVALALDATLVRMLLLPATMRYLGDANWWMPDALLRRVPRLNWAH